jgi:hypothetical protein
MFFFLRAADPEKTPIGRALRAVFVMIYGDFANAALLDGSDAPTGIGSEHSAAAGTR